jgi:hypothetical protein
MLQCSVKNKSRAVKIDCGDDVMYHVPSSMEQDLKKFD